MGYDPLRKIISIVVPSGSAFSEEIRKVAHTPERVFNVYLSSMPTSPRLTSVNYDEEEPTKRGAKGVFHMHMTAAQKARLECEAVVIPDLLSNFLLYDQLNYYFLLFLSGFFLHCSFLGAAKSPYVHKSQEVSHLKDL